MNWNIIKFEPTGSYPTTYFQLGDGDDWDSNAVRGTTQYDELKAEYEGTEHIKDNLYPGNLVNQ